MGGCGRTCIGVECHLVSTVTVYALEDIDLALGGPVRAELPQRGPCSSADCVSANAPELSRPAARDRAQCDGVKHHHQSYSPAALGHVPDVPSKTRRRSIRHVDSPQGWIGDAHSDVVCVCLLAHQPERIAPGPAGAELCCVVRTEDECVALSKCDALLQRGRLVDVVPEK